MRDVDTDRCGRPMSGIGRAWKIKADPEVVDQQGTVAAWLVKGPWHPYWSYWMVAVVHLRPIEGQSKPPYKQYPEAEHEFLIVSLESPPGSPDVLPDPDDLETLRYTTPPDCITQFHGLTDEQAASLCEDAVWCMVKLNFSPDSDFRSEWEGRIAATVEHYRAGVH